MTAASVLFGSHKVLFWRWHSSLSAARRRRMGPVIVISLEYWDIMPNRVSSLRLMFYLLRKKVKILIRNWLISSLFLAQRLLTLCSWVLCIFIQHHVLFSTPGAKIYQFWFKWKFVFLISWGQLRDCAALYLGPRTCLAFWVCEKTAVLKPIRARNSPVNS